MIKRECVFTVDTRAACLGFQRAWEYKGVLYTLGACSKGTAAVTMQASKQNYIF